MHKYITKSFHTYIFFMVGLDQQSQELDQFCFVMSESIFSWAQVVHQKQTQIYLYNYCKLINIIPFQSILYRKYNEKHKSVYFSKQVQKVKIFSRHYIVCLNQRVSESSERKNSFVYPSFCKGIDWGRWMVLNSYPP